MVYAKAGRGTSSAFRRVLARDPRLFTVTDTLTRKRRRTTYRLTLEDARERYVNPQPILQISPAARGERARERMIGHGQTLGANPQGRR